MIAAAQPSDQVPEDISGTLQAHLYISHFLSTWNSRLFEFAAVLFLASIFPDTLLPMSVYALVRSGAAILFAQPIGSLIDKGNRLRVVRISIVGQRLAVAASCGLFWVLEQQGDNVKGRKVPSLRRAPEPVTSEDNRSDAPSRAVQSRLKPAVYHILPISSLPLYFHHSAFLPSFALSFLYFTVLSFSGQMIAYLISVGYNSLHVGIARTVSTIFELSATWIAPRLIKRIGTVRGGIWSLSWQMIWLAAGVSWFFANFRGLGTDSVASATGLAVAVALSRIGLWCYDLCAQNIVQDISFSGLLSLASSLCMLLAGYMLIPSVRGEGIYSMHRHAYGPKKKHEFIYFIP
ncbi:hypothetical protein DL771_009300 [Monosporascus sp. 5C6A]|nr:hypothetical protein DL771_009300 [Monosporascus sp. 5C6A]